MVTKLCFQFWTEVFPSSHFPLPLPFNIHQTIILKTSSINLIENNGVFINRRGTDFFEISNADERKYHKARAVGNKHQDPCIKFKFRRLVFWLNLLDYVYDILPRNGVFKGFGIRVSRGPWHSNKWKGFDISHFQNCRCTRLSILILLWYFINRAMKRIQMASVLRL